jgi:hypothetical protein
MNGSIGIARGSPWRALRSGLRLSCILVLTLLLTLVWFLGKLWNRSPRRHRAWRRTIFGAWSRRTLALIGARVTMRGAPPEGPCFLVSNHHGWHDILALASAVDCVFVSMGEIRGWPLVGRMARAFDTILIDRDEQREIPRVNAEIETALARGERFRSALFENAARSGTPVAWAAIRFRTGPHDPPPGQVVAWAKRPFKDYVRGMLRADQVEIEIVCGDGVLRGDDRKELAREAEERVRALFVPLEGHEAS